MGVNRVQLLGHLGADPELRYTNGGQAIMKLRLATSERFKDKESGEWKDRTEWHRCTVWGARAEGLSKHLVKGSMVYLEGSLRTSNYEKEGQKHYSTEINVFNVQLCGGKRAEGGGGAAPGAGGNEPPADQFEGGFGPSGGADDDDIPF